MILPFDLRFCYILVLLVALNNFRLIVCRSLLLIYSEGLLILAHVSGKQDLYILSVLFI